jgi:hypothetical protein
MFLSLIVGDERNVLIDDQCHHSSKMAANTAILEYLFPFTIWQMPYPIDKIFLLLAGADF